MVERAKPVSESFRRLEEREKLRETRLDRLPREEVKVATRLSDQREAIRLQAKPHAANLTARLDSPAIPGAVRLNLAAASSASIKKSADKLTNVIMSRIDGPGHPLPADSDGLKSHLRAVTTRFISLAARQQHAGSASQRLEARFPGAHIFLVATNSTVAGDQIYFTARKSDHSLQRFVLRGDQLVEKIAPTGRIFIAAEVGKGKSLHVHIPDVRMLADPMLPPDYGVGRTVVVDVDQDINQQKKDAKDQVTAIESGVFKEIYAGTDKGEDGEPLGRMLQDQREAKGVISKYNGDGTYQIEITGPDGRKLTRSIGQDEIRQHNDPMVFSFKGSTYDDVSINVDSDPALKDFLAKVKVISDKLPGPTVGTQSERAAAQRQALVDITNLCTQVMRYPDEDKNTTDAASKTYQGLADSHSNWNTMKLGDLIACGRGVCRHQAILMQLALQESGIASRIVSATANDRQGNFRGFHAYLETTLDDGTQYLTDPTWFDAGPTNVRGYTDASPILPTGDLEKGTPLWDTLYLNPERQVLPRQNDDENKNDRTQVRFRQDQSAVIDAATGGTAVTGGADTFENIPGPASTGSATDAQKAFDAYSAANHGGHDLGDKADLGHGTAPYVLSGVWAQDYHGGADLTSTLLTGPKGTFPVYTEFRDLYLSSDTAAKLGAPISVKKLGGGKYEQLFLHGAIVQSQSDEKPSVKLTSAS